MLQSKSLVPYSSSSESDSEVSHAEPQCFKAKFYDSCVQPKLIKTIPWQQRQLPQGNESVIIPETEPETDEEDLISPTGEMVSVYT